MIDHLRNPVTSHPLSGSTSARWSVRVLALLLCFFCLGLVACKDGPSESVVFSDGTSDYELQREGARWLIVSSPGRWLGDWDATAETFRGAQISGVPPRPMHGDDLILQPDGTGGYVFYTLGKAVTPRGGVIRLKKLVR